MQGCFYFIVGENDMGIPPIDLPNMTDTTKVLTMLRDGLIAHDTRLQGLRDDINELNVDVKVIKEATLAGNPTTGLLSHAERIRILETYADGIKDTIRYWGRMVGGAMLLNFLGFMTGVIVAIIRFLPVLEALAKKP